MTAPWVTDVLEPTPPRYRRYRGVIVFTAFMCGMAVGMVAEFFFGK